MSMRPVLKLLLLSLIVFGAAFILRRMFFWDVMPVSWEQPAPRTGALEMAFLLLSIQNIAAIVAALALVLAFALWIKARRIKSIAASGIIDKK